MAKFGLDADQGRSTVQAFAEGMLSSFAHNPTLAVRDFSGEVEFDPESPQTASLVVTVKAASLEVSDSVSKKDRQEIESRAREEVLEVSKYPRIVFKSSGVTAEKIADHQFRLAFEGKLALHGVKKYLTIELQARVGDTDARLRGEFRLKQSDYNIKRVSALGGAIRVKDELKLNFELVAVKQDA